MFDLVLWGFGLYMLGFFPVYFLGPKYQDNKGLGVIMGIGLSSIGFIIGYFVQDRIQFKNLGDVAQWLTVIIEILIFGCGVIAAAAISRFVPEYRRS